MLNRARDPCYSLEYSQFSKICERFKDLFCKLQYLVHLVDSTVSQFLTQSRKSRISPASRSAVSSPLKFWNNGIFTTEILRSQIKNEKAPSIWYEICLLVYFLCLFILLCNWIERSIIQSHKLLLPVLLRSTVTHALGHVQIWCPSTVHEYYSRWALMWTYLFFK